jgi:multidrug efflux pump subunit AcrA (membrane-fusion protein)
VTLPGEFRPYLAVPIHARVSGFVRDVGVDRGSVVKQGQLLATLEAPEMQAQVVEAQARAQMVELQRAEATAKLAAAQSTYDRLKAASASPGVVAGNDLVVAEKTVEGARGFCESGARARAGRQRPRAIFEDSRAVRRDDH